MLSVLASGPSEWPIYSQSSSYLRRVKAILALSHHSNCNSAKVSVAGPSQTQSFDHVFPGEPGVSPGKKHPKFN